VTLIHTREQYPVSAPRLIEKCTLFKNSRFLVVAAWALEDGAVNITSMNFAGVSLLSIAFDFEELAARLSAFRSLCFSFAEARHKTVAQLSVRFVSLRTPLNTERAQSRAVSFPPCSSVVLGESIHWVFGDHRGSSLSSA
jgi:hypothetical protein